jgi:hypothetical protein
VLQTESDAFGLGGLLEELDHGSQLPAQSPR